MTALVRGRGFVFHKWNSWGVHKEGSGQWSARNLTESEGRGCGGRGRVGEICGLGGAEAREWRESRADAELRAAARSRAVARSSPAAEFRIARVYWAALKSRPGRRAKGHRYPQRFDGARRGEWRRWIRQDSRLRVRSVDGRECR